jgi:hypothetical protein
MTEKSRRIRNFHLEAPPGFEPGMKVLQTMELSFWSISGCSLVLKNLGETRFLCVPVLRISNRVLHLLMGKLMRKKVVSDLVKTFDAKGRQITGGLYITQDNACEGAAKPPIPVQ